MRSKFSSDEVALFQDVNPLQVAQHFLSIVGQSMVFEGGIEPGEARWRLSSFISRIDSKNRLSEAHRLAAADAVVGALRNSQDGWNKFNEILVNPLTGEEETFSFSLIDNAPKSDREPEVVVHRLTDHGAKLLLINWGAEEDYDAVGLIIENMLAKGEFRKATLRIRQHILASVAIISKLQTIRRRIGQLALADDEGHKIEELIEEADGRIASYWMDSGVYRSAIEQGVDAGGSRASDLHDLEKALNEIGEHTSGLRTEIMRLRADHSEMTRRAIAGVGRNVTLTDLRVDLLEPLSTVPTAKAIEANFHERTMAALFPAPLIGTFDPFAYFDMPILVEARDDQEEESEPLPEVIKAEKGLSIREMESFDRALREIIFASDEGITLSQITDLVERNDKLDDREKRGIVHAAALFSVDRGEKLKVIKEATGRPIFNRFVVGQDIRICPAGDE